MGEIMISSLNNFIQDNTPDIFESAGISTSIAIIGVPYINFQLPYYQMIQWTYVFLNGWLLLGGVLLIISFFANIFRTVRAKCPICHNALKEVSEPKWHCTVCDWKQP
jgi:hypothetical protein